MCNIPHGHYSYTNRGKSLVKKGLNLIIILSIVISIMSYAIGNSKTTVIGDDIEADDVCFDISPQSEISLYWDNADSKLIIKNLEWYSPNGELPGTYEEYLRNHPLKSSLFLATEDTYDGTQTLADSVSILIDDDLYGDITAAVSQYIFDLELEEHSVFLETVSGGTPEEIKDWITQRYNSGCQSFVFIGDITAAWAEVSGSVFPCDLFYMDLDGNWEDSDLDGIYEKHTAGNGDVGPELYVGRIYAHSLTYDTEANMVNDYLAKAHAYRIGKLTQPWRGLEYIDEDWYSMDVCLNRIYEDNVTHYDNGYFTTGEDYLDQMDLGQHFVQVCAHSYSGGHHFGKRPTEAVSYAHVYVYSPTTRSAKLLLGADDGIKAWLNGVNVCTNDVYTGWSPDKYKIDVTLNEGWNCLLCKISQEGGDYKFSARFTDTNYNTFNDLKYQITNPEIQEGEASYMRSWLLNGFHQDISDNFYSYLTTNYLGTNEASINPDEGDTMGGQTWARYDSGNPYIDMNEYCNDVDYGVCYAFARVNADTATSCQLWLGYDDGARVWLNGNEIVYDNRYGGYEADMTKVGVDLQAGENRLLVKISEWMGGFGFIARLCQSDGSAVEGLTYDPEPTPITHIGTWLLNGVYANPDKNTRLSTDYLGGEDAVTPSENDPAPYGSWERGIGDGYPFDLGYFFDRGDWVFSQTIQDRDPPVLFYNLFACGPGRFTDENYLAGAYIFHTTYGLITIASSKSGSMLYFDDFTGPLGEGKSIGAAFCEWFETQAPYQQWEKEWYYGMVLNGDPTLHIYPGMNPEKNVKITKPKNAIYIKNNEFLSFFTPVIIGEISVEAYVTNEEYDIERVEFFIDDELKSTDYEYPYEYLWDEKTIGQRTLKAIAYDIDEKEIKDEIGVLIFNLGL